MKPTKLYTSINEFKMYLESIEKPGQTKIMINNLFKGVFGTEWHEGYEELVDNITKK